MPTNSSDTCWNVMCRCEHPWIWICHMCTCFKYPAGLDMIQLNSHNRLKHVRNTNLLEHTTSLLFIYFRTTAIWRYCLGVNGFHARLQSKISCQASVDGVTDPGDISQAIVCGAFLFLSSLCIVSCLAFSFPWRIATLYPDPHSMHMCVWPGLVEAGD